MKTNSFLTWLNYYKLHVDTVVDQLKKDLKSKTEEQNALSRALKDLRDSMMKQAVENAQKAADDQKADTSIQKVVERETKVINVF